MADDTGSIGGNLLRLFARQQQEQAGAERQLAAPIPQAQGPSQAEMAANPNAPPVSVVRPPDPNMLIGQAADMYKRGVISQQAYDAYVAKVNAALNPQPQPAESGWAQGAPEGGPHGMAGTLQGVMRLFGR